ncbi:uncharacterized protein LTR77_009720 [Saxophila tyrrhenica]|uniref:Beta-xylanase n=1 Tax=Saxophila tyrrhenica TaxID=1690608 RepID=A0AAV9NX75_9PEZI|nr:hypothetical protein LTR77_009720 [Saxophila tyrrhenica]
MSMRSLATVAALAGAAFAAPAPAKTTDVSATTTTLLATATNKAFGLNDAAKQAGKLWFGTAVDIPGTGEAQDKFYFREFKSPHDFGEATPANIMKFDATEPEQNSFNFTGGDYFLDVAEQYGKQVRCHNLIWQSQLPNWVNNPATPWTNKTLSKVLVNHVTNLVEHFGDRCYSWDVVNEAFADSPAGDYQKNVWFNNIGPEYVPMAFAAAQKVIEKNGLKVKLYYNDYNIESPGAKTTAALNLVSELKGRGIQIDGVGLESHFIVGSTPSYHQQLQTKRAFVREGVEVVITELDVRATLPPSAAEQTQQVQDYYDSVKSCVDVAGCVGIVVWDFDDTYSWVPSTFAGQGYADLFFQPHGANHPLVKKAAYDGVLEALTGAAEGV